MRFGLLHGRDTETLSSYSLTSSGLVDLAPLVVLILVLGRRRSRFVSLRSYICVSQVQGLMPQLIFVCLRRSQWVVHRARVFVVKLASTRAYVDVIN